jgi:DNA-binding MltR family transcriptional regulator
LSSQADLKPVINDLHDQGIIDKTVFNKMQKARELRNIYQHEERAIKFSSEQTEEAEQTCIEALDCVKVLKKIYDKDYKN